MFCCVVQHFIYDPEISSYIYFLTVPKISVPIWVKDFNISNWPSTVCWTSSKSPVMFNSEKATLLSLFKWWRFLRINSIKVCVHYQQGSLLMGYLGWIPFASTDIELYQDIFMKCFSLHSGQKVTDGIKISTGQKSLSFLGPKI